MTDEEENQLGALQAVYGSAPQAMQRAVIVAVLSFIFFLILLIVFSLTQRLIFFLSSTAFLVVELFTLFGWLAQRRNELKVYEHGFIFKRQNYSWDELESISIKHDAKRKTSGEILTKDNRKVSFAETIFGIGSFFARAEMEINRRK